MSDGLHEGFRPAHEAPKPPDDRAFGLTVGGVFVAIVLLRLAFGAPFGWLSATLLALAIPLLLLAWLRPAWLAPANRAWMALGGLLHLVMTPVILFVIFTVAVLPTGLILRALGKRPLRLNLEPALDSYWIARTPDPAASFRNQF